MNAKDSRGRFASVTGPLCARGHARPEGIRCIECRRENNASWNARNRQTRLAYGRTYMAAEGRRRKFGLTKEQYSALLAEHGGMCAICQESEPCGRQLAIDHNHTTSKVRGMLCRKCNKGLGFFRDNQELLQRAALYLDHYA